MWQMWQKAWYREFIAMGKNGYKEVAKFVITVKQENLYLNDNKTRVKQQH